MRYGIVWPVLRVRLAQLGMIILIFPIASAVIPAALELEPVAFLPLAVGATLGLVLLTEAIATLNDSLKVEE